MFMCLLIILSLIGLVSCLLRALIKFKNDALRTLRQLHFDKLEKATKEHTLMAIILWIKELTEYLYQ